jgi:hypothetical protein
MRIWDSIGAWYRNLETPQAILIGAIVAPVIVGSLPVIGAYFLKQSVWISLAAVGTSLAVVVAIFRDTFWRWYRRPILKISPVEATHPHLIRIPEVNRDTGTKSKGYYVTLSLTNIGKSMAKSGQLLITKKGQHIDNQWRLQKNWLPVQVQWILDEWAMIAGKKPTEERNLIPERPYQFHALGISSNEPDKFWLKTLLMPRHQPDSYPAGTYCFEIAAFAEDAKTVRQYVHVEWEKEEPDHRKEIPDRLKVLLMDDAPW